jgi:chromate reductase, NAD(P)H dehydrogenase (quinone)
LKYIISGTNRPNSKSAEVCKIVQALYKELGEHVEMIDLASVGLKEVDGAQYGANQPASMQDAIKKVTAADGIIVVVPEYNGSMPGALKYFIDHWKYPDTFEFRPICLIGLGGRFGALRAVEHLQGVFGYRNGFIYPERVFLTDVSKTLINGEIQNPLIMDLLRSQTKNFRKFVSALQSAKLDANFVISQKA